MPLFSNQPRPPGISGTSNSSAIKYVMMAVFLCASGLEVHGGQPTVSTVRSRQVQLHYQIDGLSGNAQVELWYTRNRGDKWIHYKSEPATQQASTVTFNAPAEGLYGFILIAQDGSKASRKKPSPKDKPQRWVFIDYTPPLVQWDDVIPLATDKQQVSAKTSSGGQVDHSMPPDAASPSQVQLRWTAYDSNLPARPVKLYYQSSIDLEWRVIDDAVPNVGRYDWTIPEKLHGQITLKLAVHDQGGHIVERLYGPVPVERLRQEKDAASDQKQVSRKKEIPATQPAQQQAQKNKAEATLAAAEEAEAKRLYQRGKWHLERGHYNLAAERFAEAVQINPQMMPALHKLGKIHYRQLNFDKAVEMYKRMLKINPKHRQALLDAALAYSSAKRYPQSREMLMQILELNDKDAEAWMDLGDVMFRMGNLGSARGYWQKATKVNPSAEQIIEAARQRLKTYVPSWQGSQADSRK